MTFSPSFYVKEERAPHVFHPRLRLEARIKKDMTIGVLIAKLSTKRKEKTLKLFVIIRRLIG